MGGSVGELTGGVGEASEELSAGTGDGVEVAFAGLRRATHHLRLLPRNTPPCTSSPSDFVIVPSP